MMALVRVSLFVTCLTDTLMPETGVAVVRLLERLGHSVDFPTEQTCCGQMHLNTGYRDEARQLARRFARVFADAEIVVAPSASCVGTVRDFYPTLAVGAPDVPLASGTACRRRAVSPIAGRPRARASPATTGRRVLRLRRDVRREERRDVLGYRR